MRWEGRRQSDNIEDRRGMRVSRGGLVGGGLGTIALALLVMFIGGDPSVVLQGAGEGPVQTTERAVRGVARTKPSGAHSDRRDARLDRGRLEREFARHGRRSTASRRSCLFSDAVESGCGVAESGVGPFYCPADERRLHRLGFLRPAGEPSSAPAATSPMPTSSRTKSATTCRTCSAFPGTRA